MKRCPKCSQTYPDSERFCAVDGSELVPAEGAGGARTTRQMAEPHDAESEITCPSCGGRALPGEERCPYCGTVLASQTPPPDRSSAEHHDSMEFGSGLGHTFDDEPPQHDTSSSSRLLVWAGYALAAIIALVGGAWLALHLSGEPGKQVAVAPAPSAVASPAAQSGPVVALGTFSHVSVTGDATSNSARSVDAVTKVFAQNSKDLTAVYKAALKNDADLSDGMLVDLTIMPDGSVSKGAVIVSTAPNPALDSEIINTLMKWRFAPVASGSAKVEYPIVMARDAAGRSSVDTNLANKIANLKPGAASEYASQLPPAAAPSVAAAPSPSAIATPEVAAIPPSAPPRERPARPRARTRHALPRPKPTLLQRVTERLRTDRRFSRVKAYTASGGVVTIFGSVFDDKAKVAAVRLVKSVSGVTDVVDTLHTDTGIWAQQQNQVLQRLRSAGLGKVTIQIIGHDAYLNGEVRTEAQKEKAVTIAESVAPVRVRTNLIRVVPGGVFGF